MSGSENMPAPAPANFRNLKISGSHLRASRIQVIQSCHDHLLIMREKAQVERRQTPVAQPLEKYNYFRELSTDLLAKGNPLKLPTQSQDSLWRKEAFLKREQGTCPHPLKINLLFFQKPEKLCVIIVQRGKGDPTLKPTPIKVLHLTDQASLARAPERDTGLGVYRFQGIPEAASLCPLPVHCTQTHSHTWT